MSFTFDKNDFDQLKPNKLKRTFYDLFQITFKVTLHTPSNLTK